MSITWSAMWICSATYVATSLFRYFFETSKPFGLCDIKIASGLHYRHLIIGYWSHWSFPVEKQSSYAILIEFCCTCNSFVSPFVFSSLCGERTGSQAVLPPFGLTMSVIDQKGKSFRWRSSVGVFLKLWKASTLLYAVPHTEKRCPQPSQQSTTCVRLE